MKKDEMGGARRASGDMRDVCRFLVGKHERKRPVGNPGYRWGIMLKLFLKKRDWRELSSLI
jgi:hypothetical protein